MTAAPGLATLTAHRINVEDLMSRPMLNVIAGGALAAALALQPGLAAAAPNELPAAPSTTASTEITRPFDPHCPLCFVREFIESGSAR
ncbi:hypothetical protein [Nocardia sp. XZ_19_385]|uniref:hypothetical protein n=1 Tax=Nocardia sp. XZ_19_385 TaxID=2769488 RepID=UPI00189072E0|nr:hypothetical protein [Nocardia sp. XZ_19_385]